MFGLKRILTKLNSPPIQVSLHLFNTIAKPLLCYGCEIWGFHNDNEIEKVELNYMNYIPGNATSIAVRGELGQFPINLFWKESILKYGVEPTHMSYPTIYSNRLKFKERCLKMGKTCKNKSVVQHCRFANKI